MFELPLSGRLWPIHLKPYDDELLSSWLVRLSRAYGTTPRRFCASVWRRATFWDREIDKGIDSSVHQVLSDHTATPLAQVVNTTFWGYHGFPVRQLYGSGSSPWILNVGSRNGWRHRPWLPYCPSCLQDDDDPYFRRHWRLTFVTTCPHHGCQLLDRCAVCHAPCNIDRVLSDANAITCCYRCQFDARRAPAPRVDRTASHHRVIQWQVSLLEALGRGWYPLGRTLGVLTEEYLAVLLQLGRLLSTRNRAQELRSVFCRHIGQPYFEPSFPSSQWRALEVLSVADRFSLLSLLAWWLDDWPDRFVAMCTLAQLSLTDLGRDFPLQPDWYEAAVEQVAGGQGASMELTSYGVARSAVSSLAALMEEV